MKNVMIGLVTATLLVFGATSASALALDANITGIFTDSGFGTAVAGSSVDASGDSATATLAAGQGILLTVDVSNAEADTLTGIFATLTHQGDQLNFLGGAPAASILGAGPVFAPTSLGNIGSGAIKGNSPNANGVAGDVWVQALAFGSAAGTDGAGPDTAVTLFYVVTGASGGDTIVFDFGLTSGDAIAGAGSTTFNGAVINVPEPGTALLMGLGLLGLAGAGRRKN